MSKLFFPLRFDGPVHFGNTELGGDLSFCSTECTSDTLINALICEIYKYGDTSDIQKFVGMLKEGQIRLSDLMPFDATKTNDASFFLQKPIIIVDSKEKNQKPKKLKEVKKEATERKKQKKLTHIRATDMKNFIENVRKGTNAKTYDAFSEDLLVQRVALRNSDIKNKNTISKSMPYFVGSKIFDDNHGLYFVADIKDNSYVKDFKSLVNMLGMSGIGGKRSSGYGKFHTDDSLINKKNNDIEKIKKMLMNGNGLQMSISSLLPDKEEVSILLDEQSSYKLRKRSGFVADGTMKKNNVHMITAGSCFPKRIKGRYADIGQGEVSDIYRFGYGLYVGVETK